MSIGNVLAASGELRRKHFRAGLRTLLLEASEVNRCPQSENLSTWVQSTGTGSRTGTQTDPLGGTSAYKLDDQDATVSMNWHSANLVAYGGAYTSRGFSVYAKADTSALGNFGVFDTNAGVYKARFNLTNTGGVITAALEFGAGSVVAVIPSTDQPGWYRVLVQVTGLTIGNNHQIYLRPTDINNVAAVGAMLFWGVMAHDHGYPCHSYVQNNTNGSLTCNGDDLQFPWLVQPGALSIYAAYREIGAQGVALAEATSVRIVQIDNGANASPRIILFHPNSKEFRIQYENLTQNNSVSTTGAPTLAYGDFVELFAWVYQNGTAQIGVVVNGGAILLSPVGAALASGLPAAYDPLSLLANQRVRVGSSIGGGAGGEFKAYGLFPGIYTPDEMRSLAAQVA